MELLVEKALASVGYPLGPSDSLRRVFEMFASGLLLDKEFHLWDPCEKESVDVIDNVTLQEREDITAAAQCALRLMAFDRIHEVLGIERIAAGTPTPPNGERKRHQEVSVANDEDPKKEKKEEPMETHTDENAAQTYSEAKEK
jgi:hypothetical protein